jgi:hypothetical protein
MAVKADYWDQQVTVGACALQLRTMLASPTLTAADLNILLSLLPDALLARTDATWVGLASDAAARVMSNDATAAEAATLLRLFGSVRTVLTTDSLRQQFCSLPFPAIRLWAGLDQLTVDSENTVAVLLTAWYRHQKSEGHPPDEAQCQQLSDLLRINQLSPSFLTHLLEELPWWRRPEGLEEGFASALALALLGGIPVECTQYWDKNMLPKQPRQAEAGPGRLEWQLTQQQLQGIFDGEDFLCSSHLYWAGWEWECQVEWSAAEGGAAGKTLGMYAKLHTPAILELAAAPAFATAVITYCAAHSTRSHTSVDGSSNGWGESDMLELAAPLTKAAAVAAALGPHLQGVHIQLAMEVSKVR